MKYLYRMTHINNIPHILKYGITHWASPNANPSYVPIGNNTIIAKRNNAIKYTIKGNEIKLGNYIPFYFYARMPMLYNIQHGYGVEQVDADDIVYLIVGINNIINDPNRNYIFSDAHAISQIASLYEKNMINKLDDLLDIDAIQSATWADDYEKKERKQAEFLVEGDISLDSIKFLCCHSEGVKLRLQDMGAQMKIIVAPEQAYY